jgi:hypothetical protein
MVTRARRLTNVHVRARTVHWYTPASDGVDWPTSVDGDTFVINSEPFDSNELK